APLDPYASAAPPPAPTPAPAPAIAPAPAPTAAPAPPPAAAAGTEPAESSTPPGHLDVAAVQGLLAVQGLDGWLLADVAGENTVAQTLVAPIGTPTRRWFYLVPRTGEPTLLCHTAEVASFASLPGRHVTYSGYRDLDKQLKALLKGKRTVAMEYSPKGALPSLSRIDAGTLELVRAAAVNVKSSEVLVQFVKATWGPQGRRTHYIAAHHLVELRKDAIAFIKDQLASGKPVTELDVQQRIQRGMQLRGVIGPPPVVAFGSHTADPDYVPTEERAATLRRGDVVLLSLAGKVDGGIYAALTWVAVAERAPSPELASTFEAAVQARDAALAFIRDRLKRRRAMQGWEVDRAARDLLAKGGLEGHAIHRTGHSLDTDLQGSGTDLDDLEVKDQRNLVVGTGFTVGPGLYYEGDLGVRTEVSAYLGKDGLEVTTPLQEQVEPLLGGS
ncbi:MAG TPA: M24 family metallopeptidase, partial [Kofleriaceae bacterium]|nr:M24 family metallopeptidase [Kofleriaceae bacterium]